MPIPELEIVVEPESGSVPARPVIGPWPGLELLSVPEPAFESEPELELEPKLVQKPGPALRPLPNPSPEPKPVLELELMSEAGLESEPKPVPGL